jgi:hypothetical protein
VSEAQPAAGQAWRQQREADPHTVRRLPFRATPATAWALAGLTLLLAAALIPLSLATHQNPLATGGANIVIALAFAGVGLVVAWHRPRNPIGWLMLAVAVVPLLFYTDSGLYNVFDYRLGHRLPLAPVVLVLYHASQPVLGLIPLTILLFPDGRLPSPRWRWAVGGYLTLALADMIVQAQMSVYALTHHRTQVTTNGQLLLSNGPYSVFFAPVGLTFFAFWGLAAGYQIVSWRRAAGERRHQLSWLMAGGAAAFISFTAAILLHIHHGGWQVFADFVICGVTALPVGMGVAILKYRLYEIDRIISRTLAYAIVTGLLLGVYAGLVLLATRVLSFHSSAAVAVATLVAAALFNPLRRRVQVKVDRRFNRARYDAEQIVAAFATRLKDTVDLDSVRDDLAGVVHQALEPGHVSMWINRPQALLRAGCRPCAEQHGRSGYQLGGPFPFVPQPLLKRLHADLLGGGHSGAHDQRLGDTHGLHQVGKADLIAVLSGPQPGPGQRIRGAVDADHGAVRSHQVGGHERHVPGAAAYIQYPHAGPDARLGEDHPGRRGNRRALDLKASHLVFADTAAELVAGAAVIHRVASRQARNDDPAPGSGQARPRP